MRIWSVLILVALAACAPVDAGASPIVYEFTGLATGDLGGSAFTSDPFRLTLAADTNDVMFIDSGGYWAVEAAVSTFTRTAAGVSATFIGSTGMISDATQITAAVTDPLLAPLTILLAFSNVDLIGYDLTTAIGPILTDLAIAGIGPYATSLGDLNFTVDQEMVTFEATAAVPEPGTLLLLSSGMAGLAGAARRRHQRRAQQQTAAEGDAAATV